ncbi:interactor of constitutive active ROPs 3 [Heracleum sosnowskyi]|uniref:Interactor of constitutive active ROPs 3 n=1 Tax=Heracleum sosnowskyi TaxID=360622 RepID=A0AAD8H092_9APIA|nr:interactor of constitutive active ROPs 3 [Heracleum sosnowskyi]
MQTPKARKSSSEVTHENSPQSSLPEVFRRLSAQSASPEVPHKISPRSASKVPQKISGPEKITPRVARQLKTSGVESDSASSSNHLKTSKDKSPKINDRKSPRSPVPERKHPSKVADLESHISQLQDDLNKVKDQLSVSDLCKQQAEQDAQESKEKILAMSLKLEESQQLLSQSLSDEPQSVESEKITNVEHKVFQSELDASETLPSKSSAELASALDEIRQLKLQLEMVTDLEARQTKQAELASAELLSLKENLEETRLIADEMKTQLRECKDSEVQAQTLVSQTLLQLETAKRRVETLGSDNSKAKEAYNAIASELDQSKARVSFLEELVTKLTKEKDTISGNNSQNLAGEPAVKYGTKENEEGEESIKAELECVTSEVEHLRSALETTELRYHEEQIQNTLQIASAYELVEKIKSTSSQREDELESELKKVKADIQELRANLMDKETELQGICEENEVMKMRLETTLSGSRGNQLEKELLSRKIDAESIKSNLKEKEMDIQTILEENEILKLGSKEMDFDLGNVGDEAVTELYAARAAERDTLMKLGYATGEADKSHRRAAQMTEQLEAARFANSELEAELRRVKVQSDQWRKAAEAAATMLSTGNNGKLVERTGSLDSSRYPEDMDDEFLKKKNGNMLKKIGVLWKKQQK